MKRDNGSKVVGILKTLNEIDERIEWLQEDKLNDWRVIDAHSEVSIDINDPTEGIKDFTGETENILIQEYILPRILKMLVKRKAQLEAKLEEL